jgi:5'-3' exoribonuclease 1
MGIHRFWPFFRQHFSQNIIGIKKDKTLLDIDVHIDNFMIDLNGLFHNSTQKIYEYGNFKPIKRFGIKVQHKEIISDDILQLRVFEDICNNIEMLFNIATPTKRLILCVDGSAPQSKQNQQRSRRFRSAVDRVDLTSFDSCNLTPGTVFMDNLTKYIDWYIRKRITESDNGDHTLNLWKNIEIIFSSEKVPGEGEHKLLNYIRSYGSFEDTYCIHGMDADLIMLALVSHAPKFFILREDPYDNSNDFFVINIGSTRVDLIELLRWSNLQDNSNIFNEESVINDFIFICFIVGNDFLPHVPSIEIIDGGLESVIDIYKTVCQSYGHITKKWNKKVVLVKKTLRIFFGSISQYEKANLEEKMLKRRKFLKDELLERNCIYNHGKKVYDLNLENYHSEYYRYNFKEGTLIENICLSYLEGLQWVLSYYTKGVSNWDWYYPYHYAPSAKDLASNLHLFRFINYEESLPIQPFRQLMSVLPKQSFVLLPEPLSSIFENEENTLDIFFPDEIQIDFSGKRKEYEGVVLLPFIDRTILCNLYDNLVQEVDINNLHRNMVGNSYIYSYNNNQNETGCKLRFISSYGNIDDCKVNTSIIDL